MPEHTPNLRDLGGLPTGDGRTVAHHRVLRSAAPSVTDVAPAGITWPPSVVIDLRSSAEADPIHPLASTGARVVNLPLLRALAPGDSVESLYDLYLLLLDHAPLYLIELVREVGLAQGPTLIHCAAGKDRTGVASALVLRLVGVPRDVVRDDYLLTAEAAPQIQARLSKGARQHQATIPASFFDVSPEAIDGVMDVWDEHELGVDGWFLAAGGTQEHIDRLRHTLLA
ncbi:MAG: protein tyrosine phosphatase [Aeromicrobium sp.]|nr:protein tyrosine phosphatase [Aeromicrobium sp.]